MAHELFSTKHRIFWSRGVGVVVVAYVLLSHPPTILPPWTLELGGLLGLVLLAAAAFGRVWCLIFVAGKKKHVLITDGPYSIVRNPLYIFSFFGAVGFGLAVENPILAGLLAVLFAVYYAFVVKREERILAARFGPLFQEYCARIPRWLPTFSFYKEPQTVSVYPAQIRNGIFDAMWFIWLFVLWELIEELRHIGVIGTAL